MNEQSMENLEVQTTAPAKSQYLIDLENEVNGDIASFMPKVIGQGPVKKQLRQRIKTFLRTRDFAPTLLVAPRGFGKTNIVRGWGKRLPLSTNDSYRPFIDLNGGSLKSISAFLDAVGQYLAGPDGGGSEVTIFIDEVHAADKKVRDFLLSFISPNSEGRARVLHNGQEFEIDYRMVSVILATTDAQKLTEAFKSRCAVIGLTAYSKSEMATILNQYIDAFSKKQGVDRVAVTESSEADLVSICRGTPRFAVKNAENLVSFCANEGITNFDRKAFLKFVKEFDIHPYGLNRNELRVLEALQRNGAMTLTALSASTGLEQQMIRKDCELVMHENGLIIIDGNRSITARGREVLAGW